MRTPWRRRCNLVERLRPYVQPMPLSEPMASADPLRMFLYRWMIETGDPVEVIVAGFDLDLLELQKLLNREILALTETTDRVLRRKVGLTQATTAEVPFRSERGNLHGSQNRPADER